MRICVAMLFDGISRKFPCFVGKNYDGDLDVGRILSIENSDVNTSCALVFYDVDRRFDNGDRVNASRKICVIPDDRPIPFEIPCAFFVRSNGHSIEQVIDRAFRSYHWYSSWGDSLFEILVRKGSLQEFLDYAHVLFENPIIISDSTLRVYCNTANDAMPDQLWVDGGAGYADARDIPGVDIPRLKRQLENNTLVQNHEGAEGVRLTACLLSSEWKGADFLFACLLDKNRSVTRGDGLCFEYFSSLVKLVVERELGKDTIGEDSLSTLFSSILTGAMKKREDFDQFVNMSKLSLASTYHVFVIEADGYYANGQQLSLVERAIKGIDPCMVVLRDAQCLAVVVNSNLAKGLPVNEYHDIDLLMMERRMRCGISEPGSNPFDLPHLRDQAQMAIRIGRRVSPSARVFPYADYRRYAAFEICSSAGRASDFIHSSLALLRRYDDNANGVLFDTLKCYVYHGGNQVSTAKDLVVQRNTLRYRLSRIEELCSIDLKDVDTISYLNFSFRLLAYVEGSAFD